MSIPKRRLKYFSIKFSEYHNNQEITKNPKDIIETFYNNFLTLYNQNPLQLEMDIKNNRFCILSYDELEYDYPYFTGYFISAKINHKPPLIDKQTLSRRDNPKQDTEGEEERTHFAMKIDESSNEIILLLESRNVGITENVILKYIKKLLYNNNIEYNYSIMARDEFLDELDELYQVKACDIFVQKQIIGSESLNFADISDNMQEELKIEIKAKRKKSIKDSAKEIAQKFLAGTEERIKRIKVFGLDNNKNPVIINTTEAQLDAFVNVELDEITKIVKSNDILPKMKNLLERM